MHHRSSVSDAICGPFSHTSTHVHPLTHPHPHKHTTPTAAAAPERPKKRVTSPAAPMLQPECSERMPRLGIQ